MPDVGIPGAEFIFGKENSEIAHLLSSINDYTLIAKYLHDLYSTADAAEILGCGYMRYDHVIATLNESNMTIAGAASILSESESSISSERVRDVLDDGDMTGSKVWDIIPHANLTRTFHIWVSNGMGDMLTAVGCNACNGGQVWGHSFGGQIGGYGTTETERYYLELWTTAAGDLNTEVGYHVGFGIFDEGISCGGWTGSPLGNQVANTERFDGVWVVGNDMGTAVYNHAGTGTWTAGLSFGGTIAGFVHTTNTEEYNGTNWTTSGVGDLNTVAYMHSGAGTQNAGLSFGGYSHTTETEEYNGSSWAAAGVGDLNTGRRGHGGVGTQIAGLCCGGSITSAIMEKSTEEYDGSVWSVTTDMISTRDNAGTFGSQENAVSCGSEPTSNSSEAYI